MSTYFLIFRIYHDVDIEGSKPINNIHRINPMKLQCLRQEIQYLLDRVWSSLCILVPKPDGTFHMCTGYRKVNSVTKPDPFSNAQGGQLHWQHWSCKICNIILPRFSFPPLFSHSLEDRSLWTEILSQRLV